MVLKKQQQAHLLFHSGSVSQEVQREETPLRNYYAHLFTTKNMNNIQSACWVTMGQMAPLYRVQCPMEGP
jgi:hypothetical protein